MWGKHLAPCPRNSMFPNVYGSSVFPDFSGDIKEGCRVQVGVHLQGSDEKWFEHTIVTSNKAEKKNPFSAERPAAALTSPAHCQRSVSPQLELLVCSFHNPGFRSHFGKILHTNATCSGCPPVAHTVLVSAPSASGNAGFWSESEDFQQWILLNG